MSQLVGFTADLATHVTVAFETCNTPNECYKTVHTVKETLQIDLKNIFF